MGDRRDARLPACRGLTRPADCVRSSRPVGSGRPPPTQHPEDSPPINGRRNRVLPGDAAIEQRLLDRHRQPRKHAIPINPRARHSVHSFRDIDPVNLEFRAAARRHLQLHSRPVQNFLPECVPVARYVKDHRLTVESRIVDRGNSRRVRHEHHLAGSAKFHQRDAPPRHVVRHVHHERRRCANRGNEKQKCGNRSHGRYCARISSAWPNARASVNLATLCANTLLM